MESIIWLGFHRVYDGVLFNVEGWFPSLFQFTFLFSQCVRIMTAFGIYQLSFSIQSETWINLSADVTPYTSLAPGWFTSDEDVILGHFTQNYFSTFISSFFLPCIFLAEEEILFNTSWYLHGNFRLKTECCLSLRGQAFAFDLMRGSN